MSNVISGDLQPKVPSQAFGTGHTQTPQETLVCHICSFALLDISPPATDSGQVQLPRTHPPGLGCTWVQASSLQASSPQLADEDLDFRPLSKHCFLVLPKATPEPLWHHHSPQIVRRAHVSNLPEPTFMVKLPWGALGCRPP